MNTRYQWDGCHWQLRVFGFVGLDSNSHLCGKVLIAGGQVFFYPEVGQDDFTKKSNSHHDIKILQSVNATATMKCT